VDRDGPANSIAIAIAPKVKAMVMAMVMATNFGVIGFG
jgi:hypothetical protein